MNKILKRFVFFLLLVFVFLFSFACTKKQETQEAKPSEKTPTKTQEVEPTEPVETKTATPVVDEFVPLTIYSLNDFHGVLFSNAKYPGISRLGDYLVKNKNDNTLIVSAGDMFQGTAVSSMTRGRAVVDVMNYIGFDAMALGNHEFDWGIDVVLKYQDSDDSNGEADFPFLCANCKDLRTGDLASWCIPYTVTERAGLKIGMVGIIGSSEESSILPSNVVNFDFTDEVTAIKKYTKILRQEENCDLVLVIIHDDSESYNQALVNLSGEYRIDAIFNGHTHQAYYGDYKRSDGTVVPYVQSSCYGSYIGKISLLYDRVNKKVAGASAINIQASTSCRTESKDINAILANYQEYIDIANEDLGYSGVNIYKDKGGEWAATVLKDFGEGDVGICNTGGIRSNAFPISQGIMVKYDNIFQIMPFENMIVKCDLKGSDVIKLITSNYYISNNVNSSSLTINGVAIDRDKYYTVVTIDYLYEQSYTPFSRNGINYVHYDKLFREALVDAFIQNANDNGGRFIW